MQKFDSSLQTNTKNLIKEPFASKLCSIIFHGINIAIKKKKMNNKILINKEYA